MKKITTVLVAVDFSDSSDNAFQLALTMAKSFSAKLIVLHVMNEELIDGRAIYGPHISSGKMKDEIEASAKIMMEVFCQEHIHEFDNFEALNVLGSPYQQIIGQAEKKSADLIVIGTHGRAGLERMLIGSTAEKVVRQSTVPVVTVKLPKS